MVEVVELDGDVCPECGYESVSRNGLKIHFSRKHPEKLRGDQYPWEGEGDAECPTCEKLCANQAGVRRHHKWAHGESIARVERTCAVCGESEEMYKSELAQLKHDDLCEDCARKRRIPHTEEAKRKISENLPGDWQMTEEGERARLEGWYKWYNENKTEWDEHLAQIPEPLNKEAREKISQTLMGHEVSEATREKIRENSSPGYRLSIDVEETGHTVRSTWEKEIDLLLHESGRDYEYEPGPFDIGGRTYLPDFRVGGVIVEVKGYADDYSQARGEAFMEHHPDFEYLVLGDGSVPHDTHLPWERRGELLEMV